MARELGVLNENISKGFDLLVDLVLLGALLDEHNLQGFYAFKTSLKYLFN